MWSEIAIAGGFTTTTGLILKWFHSRMTKMERDRRKEFYQPNGQTNYVPRSECKNIQDTFCIKIEEVKTLIMAMDKKRETAKDEYHEGQQRIGERLAAIEAKLP